MAAQSAASRVRRNLRDILGGGRFTCACCPGKTFRGHKALNAHHLARHGNYWAGQNAKKIGRKIGKEADAVRKHARGWLEAHGHVDRFGHRTDKARSRPEAPVRGHLTWHQLREMHRHGRDHDRAERHEGKAERTASPDRRIDRHHRAANLRNRWPERAGRTR